MSIDNFDERLARMQPHFDQASADPAGQFDLPPDGDYQALVRGFDFFEARDHIFLKTELEVANHPDHAGRRAETVHDLEDPNRIEWLKKHLATLGADVNGLDLTQVRPGSPLLLALCDTPVEIKVKTSDKRDKDGNYYRNVYVNKRLGDPLRSDVPAPSPEPVGAAVKDDEIPFRCRPVSYADRYHGWNHFA